MAASWESFPSGLHFASYMLIAVSALLVAFVLSSGLQAEVARMRERSSGTTW
jgi:hypothetical protein